ncbi:MAG TPA: transcription factor S [Thermoplasmata archaeon]|nr:transcription factor S [Thermoplasmata archaeon]
MICPKCKMLMYPRGDELVCKKCGYSRKKGESRIFSIKRREREIPVVEGDMTLQPKIEVICPKCGNTEAYWVLKQTRASDEPETKIYTCTKCGYRWRE